MAAQFPNHFGNVHDIEQYRDIIELTKDTSQNSERIAVLETHYKHVDKKLNDIDEKLDVILDKQSKTDGSFMQSKGFIGGVFATITIVVSIISYLAKLALEKLLR